MPATTLSAGDLIADAVLIARTAHKATEHGARCIDGDAARLGAAAIYADENTHHLAERSDEIRNQSVFSNRRRQCEP
jgi:hypothetical protein